MQQAKKREEEKERKKERKSFSTKYLLLINFTRGNVNTFLWVFEMEVKPHTYLMCT